MQVRHLKLCRKYQSLIDALRAASSTAYCFATVLRLIRISVSLPSGNRFHAAPQAPSPRSRRARPVFSFRINHLTSGTLLESFSSLTPGPQARIPDRRPQKRLFSSNPARTGSFKSARCFFTSPSIFSTFLQSLVDDCRRGPRFLPKERCLPRIFGLLLAELL
jgi:hypothetical protein